MSRVAGFVTVAIALAVLLADRLSQPLANLAQATQAVARGDEGFLLGLAYSVQRGFGGNHPFAGEIRMGEVAVDSQRVSIWGASMGGQGATTIGLHQPDRFALIVSFFGDAKFNLSTYAHALLPTEQAAHKVNPLDVVDNARHVPL